MSHLNSNKCLIKIKYNLCKETTKKNYVKVYGAVQPVLSYQCGTCDYFSFDPASSKKVLEELSTELDEK